MALPPNHPHLKFRPVLTLTQIQHIIHIIDKCLDDEDVNLNKSLKRVLVPMLAKIETGAINPAYKLSEIHAQKQIERTESTRYNNGEMTAQEEAIYEAKIMGI